MYAPSHTDQLKQEFSEYHAMTAQVRLLEDQLFCRKVALRRKEHSILAKSLVDTYDNFSPSCSPSPEANNPNPGSSILYHRVMEPELLEYYAMTAQVRLLEDQLPHLRVALRRKEHLIFTKSLA